MREIQALLGSLRGDAPAVQKDRAAFELAKLSQNSDEDEYMQAIWLTNGIPLLVALVREGTEMQKDHATIALFYASHDTYNQKEIVTAGGISALLALLGQDATNLQKENAMLMLKNLAAAKGDDCAAIVDAGVIPPLVALLNGVATDLQKAHAMDLLMSLTITRNADRDAAIRNAIAVEGGISALEALASGGATELQKQMATNTLKLINRRKPLPGLDFLPVYNLQRARGRTRGADG